MEDMIVLFSNDCPKCRVIKKKLDSAGIEYTICANMDRLRQKGLMTVPVLKIKENYYPFSEAVNWINKQ